MHKEVLGFLSVRGYTFTKQRAVESPGSSSHRCTSNGISKHFLKIYLLYISVSFVWVCMCVNLCVPCLQVYIEARIGNWIL